MRWTHAPLCIELMMVTHGWFACAPLAYRQVNVLSLELFSSGAEAHSDISLCPRLFLRLRSSMCQTNLQLPLPAAHSFIYHYTQHDMSANQKRPPLHQAPPLSSVWRNTRRSSVAASRGRHEWCRGDSTERAESRTFRNSCGSATGRPQGPQCTRGYWESVVVGVFYYFPPEVEYYTIIPTIILLFEVIKYFS